MDFKLIKVLKEQKTPWKVPAFIDKYNKNNYGLMLIGLTLILYMPANHFHFFEPRFLTITWLDQVIPFFPQTVWAYVSEYPYFFFAYLGLKDELTLSRYFLSFLLLQLVSVIIFWLWPTTYPRELFPLPNSLDPLTHEVFSNLRITDTPANCCPSLHVSSVYLSSFIFYEIQDLKKFTTFFIWSGIISLSTLTTKQHYVIDVVTGITMALIVHWLFNRFVQFQKMTQTK